MHLSTAIAELRCQKFCMDLKVGKSDHSNHTIDFGFDYTTHTRLTTPRTPAGPKVPVALKAR